MPVRLKAQVSRTVACVKAAFEGSLRNHYFQVLKLTHGGRLFTEHPPCFFVKNSGDGRLVSTGLQRNVTVREENSIAALEVMSRSDASPLDASLPRLAQ